MEEELRNTIVGLKKVISELRNEKEIIKRVDEAMITELKISNKELGYKNFDLNVKLGSMQKTTEGKLMKTINELRDEIAKLKEEKDQALLVKEEHLVMIKTNGELRVEISKLKEESEKTQLVKEENLMLIKTNSELREQNTKLKEEMDRTHLVKEENILTIKANNELRAEISKLKSERDHTELSKEESLKVMKTNHELRVEVSKLEEERYQAQLFKEGNLKMIKTINELREQNSKLGSERIENEKVRTEFTELQRTHAKLCLELELAKKMIEEENGKLQHRNAEHSHEIDRVIKAKEEEKAEFLRKIVELELIVSHKEKQTEEVRQKYSDLMQEKEQRVGSDGEVSMLKEKIEELQEELSELIQERDALDNVERARSELNMKRLNEKIAELTIENRNLAQKFKDETEQLNLIVELQNQNLAKEMKMTEETNERQRIKDEENNKVIIELRRRVSELESTRVHKESVTAVDEEEEAIKSIKAVLAQIKQLDRPEEKDEIILTVERPLLQADHVKGITEKPKELTSPVPNDPQSVPPPLAPPRASLAEPPVPAPTPTSPQSVNSQKLPSHIPADVDPATPASAYGIPLVSPVENRSSLITELQTALRFREAALEQSRVGNFEVASIVRRSIRVRGKSAHRVVGSGDGSRD